MLGGIQTQRLGMYLNTNYFMKISTSTKICCQLSKLSPIVNSRWIWTLVVAGHPPPASNFRVIASLFFLQFQQNHSKRWYNMFVELCCLNMLILVDDIIATGQYAVLKPPCCTFHILFWIKLDVLFINKLAHTRQITKHYQPNSCFLVYLVSPLTCPGKEWKD